MTDQRARLVDKPCQDCGGPQVWLDVWQGVDCPACIRKDREQFEAREARIQEYARQLSALYPSSQLVQELALMFKEPPA